MLGFMSWLNGIKQFSQKMLLGAGLSAFLFSADCAGQERKLDYAKKDEIREVLRAEAYGVEKKERQDKYPVRVLSPYLISNGIPADPRDGFEANGQYLFSVNELFGKGSDYLGIGLQGDEFWPVRLGLLAVHKFIADSTVYASHEIAHNFYSRKIGKDSLEFKLGHDDRDFLSWSWFHAASNTNESLWDVNAPLDPMIRSFVAGLNQQEHNKVLLYEHFAKESQITFDQAINFSLNNTGAMGYIITTMNTEIPSSRGQLFAGGTVYDPIGYLSGLNMKGIEISRDALLLQTGVPAFLNVKEIYGLLSVVDFIRDGSRVQKSLWFNAGCLKMMPPLFSTYFTTDGLFYNATVFAKIREPPQIPLLEFQLGADSDYISDGRVNAVRFGGKVHDLAQLSNTWLLSPFAYCDLQRVPLDFSGFVAGVEVKCVMYDGENTSFSFVGKGEYSDNDVIENRIKDEEKGFNLSVGAEFRF